MFVHSICRSSCLNLRFLAPCMPSRAAVQRSLTIKHQGGIESIRPSHHPSERSPQSFHQNTHKHQSRLNVMPLGFRGLKPDRGSSFSAFCVLHKLRSPDSSAFLSPSAVERVLDLVSLLNWLFSHHQQPLNAICVSLNSIKISFRFVKADFTTLIEIIMS